MARFILLDSGVIGFLCTFPQGPNASACKEWVERMQAAGASIVIPEVTYFEVKRGLLWRDTTGKLARFDQMVRDLEVIPVTFKAWDKAAEFWALLYKQGQPTADPKSLDADAVLAGVAATVAQPGDTSVIATTNQRHLDRFPGVDAQSWLDIN